MSRSCATGAAPARTRGSRLGTGADSGPRDWRLARVSSTACDTGVRAAGSRPRAARADRAAASRASRVGEQQLTVGIEDGDGVFEAVDDRLERPLAGQLLVLRQLRAHGVEEVAELAELVLLRQVHHHAELALAQAGQAASDDVDRPEQQLRQEHRDQARRHSAASAVRSAGPSD